MRSFSFLILSPLIFASAFIYDPVFGARNQVRIRGHDISSLIMLENSGKQFKLNNTRRPLETILAMTGANYVRSRVWVNPRDGNYGLEYNLKLGKRVKNAGLGLFLDLHYSDDWADPGHQTLPAAWPKNINDLVNTVKSYTQNVVKSFANQGMNVDIISIGNEIANGFMWPLGKIENFDNIVKLIRAGVQGARAGNPSKPPRILIHLNNGFDTAMQQWFYDQALAHGLSSSDFDIMGVSFYPYESASTFANLKKTATTLANKFKKDVLVVETDWPTKCTATMSERIIYSPQGQTQWVRGINDALLQVPGGRGLGIFYWEPAFLNNAGLGSPCSDELLFDWSTGNAFSSIGMYQ